MVRRILEGHVPNMKTLRSLVRGLSIHNNPRNPDSPAQRLFRARSADLYRGSSRQGQQSLASRLKAAREAKGWTQEELVRESRIGHPVIRHIEAGRSRRPNEIVKIARALGAKPAPLAFGSNARAPKFDDPARQAQANNATTAGSRLVALRKDRELTQKALATRAGVSAHTIQRMENNDSAWPLHLEAVAKALATNPGWVLFGSGP